MWFEQPICSSAWNGTYCSSSSPRTDRSEI